MSKGEPKVPGALHKGLKKISDRTEKTLDNLPQVCYTIITGEANPTNAERVDTMTKMTYVAALTYVLENVTDLPADVAEKLTALKAQTEKRNSAERKPTKAQVANEALKATVLSVLTSEPATVTELMARSADLSALSNQKVSALVNALVDENKATKTVDKRKSYFALA